MTDMRPGDGAVPLPIGALTLPSSVQEALRATTVPAPGQLVRAKWGEVARFVLLVRAIEEDWIVAPVTLDPELATDEANLLGPEETDFEVPVAVWLDLAVRVRPIVLERGVGQLRISVTEARRAPTGRRVRSPLDERAMERAVLQDDLADLAAAVAPQERGLAELLDGLDLDALGSVGIPTAEAYVLLRGERPVTPQEAALLAPLAGVAAEELMAAGPRLPDEVVHRVLTDPAVAPLVRRLAEQEELSAADAGEPAVQAAYAYAARETGRGEADLVARTVQYLKALLRDE